MKSEKEHRNDEAVFRSLSTAVNAVLKYREFEDAARVIFDESCRVTGARSGYVALLSDDGSENELLFLEAGGLPCTVDPDLPMPIRGLREVAYRENRVVYDNDFMNSRWVQFMPGGHVELKNVLFAPLVLDNKTVGIIGLANKPEDFSERDARFAGTFGDYAAIALQNSRMLDRLNRTVTDLQNALTELKSLRGILPICSYCKKIRDEKGAWKQLEEYVSTHSEADFSHGICPECVEKLND